MKKELKYYGFHACFALWKKRPQDIIRVYLDSRHVKILGPVLKWCAQEKKAYHIVPEKDLEKVTDSVHHEGICILAKEASLGSVEELFSQAKKNSKMCLLYLDGVENPHNIGSILRTAAHFGIPFVLGEKLSSLSPSACRIAKGGAEHVRLISLSNPIQTFEKLKSLGFSLITTSSHGGTSLFQFRFPSKSILVLGSESGGIGKSLLKLSSHKIQIPGSGHIESLNVSVAAALCLGEYCKQAT